MPHPLLSVLLVLTSAPLHAGLLQDPSHSCEVWYPREWVAAPPAPNEIVPEAAPGRATVSVLESIDLGAEGLTWEAIALIVKDLAKARKAGKVIETAPLEGLNGKTGAVVYTLQVGRGGLRQHGFALLPIGDGKGALILLETEQTSAFNDHRPDFLRIAATAAKPGVLQDIPIEEQRDRLRAP